MTEAEMLINIIEKMNNDSIDILKKKNADYAGDSKSAFSNFELCEALNITDVQSGIMVRLCDKVARICNLLKKDARVKEESIDDTIADARNYLAILYAYRKMKLSKIKIETLSSESQIS